MSTNDLVQQQPFVELAFPTDAKLIPRDCGYLIAAGIKSCLQETVGTASVKRFVSNCYIGIRLVNDETTFTSKFEFAPRKLVVRLPQDYINLFLPLAGKYIRIRNVKVTLGPPQVSALRGSLYLKSRIATIKGFEEPHTFFDAANRQLESAGLSDIKLSLGTDDPSLSRKTILVRGKLIVGFSLKAICITAESSIALQSIGIGGRRHFGAGVFISDYQLSGKSTNRTSPKMENIAHG